MGMFDDVVCEYPIEGVTPGMWFQTKDFDCQMDKYTITREGRLIHHTSTFEEVPLEERPGYQKYLETGNELWALQGCLKRVPTGDVDLNYHGILNFYCFKEPDQWLNFDAKFTDGTLVSVKRLR